MAEMNFRYFKAEVIIPTIGIAVFSAMKISHYCLDNYKIAISAFALAGLFFSLIDKYLWKYPPFRYLFKIKNFAGSYEGFLYFQYVDSMNQIQTGSMKHVKKITQTASSIVINTITYDSNNFVSSKSESQIEHIEVERDGSYKIYYTYLNKGNMELNYPTHYGTEILHINYMDKKIEITGEYYTNRLPFQTKGTIELNKI
jgi:hypothetical protein